MWRMWLHHLRWRSTPVEAGALFFRFAALFGLGALALGSTAALTPLDAANPYDEIMRSLGGGGLALTALTSAVFVFGAVGTLWRRRGRDTTAVMVLIALLALGWAGRGVWLIASGWALAPALGWYDRVGYFDVAETGGELRVRGEINTFLVERMGRALAAAPQASVLRIESGGGSIGASYKIAAMVGEAGLDVVVTGDCSSACVFVFLAGDRRILAPQARLGCHQASDAISGRTVGSSGVFRDLELAGEAAAVRDRVVGRCDATPPSRIHAPSLGDLEAMGVVTHVGRDAHTAEPAGEFCAARPSACGRPR